MITIKSQRHQVENVEVLIYTIPTDYPEADGTLAWDSTTIVIVEVGSGATTGLGYTYADASTAQLIRDTLRDEIIGVDAMNVAEAWSKMVNVNRNLGRPGMSSMAISAVDSALWDLKARLLDLPLATLLGAVRSEVPVYGSGGFTSYPVERLCRQLGNWVAAGIPRVKMKIGTHPEADLDRVRAAREAIGPQTALFVDANGAYDRKQALAMATTFSEFDVTWFEEPVSSDDLHGFRLMRDRAPAGMDIAAGEYGYDQVYFRRMLEAGSVDVLQADASRCAGITGFLRAAILSNAFEIPFSAHTAPSLHVHPCCAVENLRHLEYFHDHVRIEHMMFDGCLTPVGGVLCPDLNRPGLGLELKRRDADQWRVTA